MTPVSLFQRHISGVTSAPARRHRITYPAGWREI